MVNRNAVLPQFMTWLNQVGAVSSSLKFLGTCPVYRSENNLHSSRIKQSIDQKTLLAVTNVAARPYSSILGGDTRSGQDEQIDRGQMERNSNRSRDDDRAGRKSRFIDFGVSR